ncbi:methionine biosynthesis protein MetW [Gammaproteobacteria bacterium 53_120_T64]|nr:methionine biosynthesis protein MetW [Gammaproteobacteria bacterium 53_120_T64]
MRIDLDILQQWIPMGGRVLDLGCGDGTLMCSLADNRQVTGYGLEIDPEQITTCISRGVNVIETDLNQGLDNFQNDSFDTVIMTYSLQVMRRPDQVIDEMLRVGKECIVTFPNFGNIRTRSYLMLRGRMPVTKQLSHQWYDTPNIHFCTVHDFDSLCAEKAIRILHREVVTQRFPDKQLKGLLPNLFGETAIYHLAK